MSRPSGSVPSQCAALGGARRASMSMSVGLWIGSTPASAAASPISTIQATAARNNPPTRRRLRTGETSVVSPSISSTAMADPRIEHGVEHVDDEVHYHEARRDEQHNALQDDEVAGVDRADQQAADAGQREDGLDDQRAAAQPADTETRHRHQSEQRGV